MSDKNEDQTNKIILLLMEGLYTDGGHHKQWYLDQVLKELIPDQYEKIYNDVVKHDGEGWDKGIAP